MKQFNQTDREQAISWWNSLPGGKKRYLKEHSKLGTPEKVTRYWLANIQAPISELKIHDLNHVEGKIAFHRDFIIYGTATGRINHGSH